MKNIWKLNRDVSADVKRNNFDLSFASHSTFKFGYLYPVFKRKVYPGDSFKISSAFDLKMMPVEFPVQSRMRAHMHFFYVKHKNLWDNFEDWIDGLRSNSECPHPYISISDTEFKTRSIHDFMNQPTTIVSGSNFMDYGFFAADVQNGQPLPRNLNFPFYRGFVNAQTRFSGDFQTNTSTPSPSTAIVCGSVTQNIGSVFNFTSNGISQLRSIFPNLTSIAVAFVKEGGTERPYVAQRLFEEPPLTIDPVTLNSTLVESVNTEIRNGSNIVMYLSVNSSDTVANRFIVPNFSMVHLSTNVVPNTFTQFSDFASEHSTHVFDREILLDAMPYRAYEAIYRAYYANDILQPLVINGRKEYNKFVTNSGDGADSTSYHLFRRNYEYDFLTSAFPSPQAGAAPLVGINQLGQVTIEDENGITTGQAVLDSDGHVTDIVVTSPLASIEHGRTAMNIAQLGMSINDFRNANALQRLKERFMRGGFRYKPWKKAVWGVTSSDDSLDLPIFIGGYSRDIQISPIYSQANTLDLGGSALGDWAGVGRVVGGSNHDVQHFFDDYGFVIGVLSITPVPAYSQMLPKENLCPTNYLDYYFPDMSKLGMQPITYKEVTPLQSYIDGLSDSSKKLTDTFGYQRPNYDMVGSIDEVHGDFRDTLRQQLINRIFAHRPELGTDFLEVNPSDINDIFINTNPDDDVFIGHLAFRIYSKRPLPRVYIPGLGF